jgi:hypothetical protein
VLAAVRNIWYLESINWIISKVSCGLVDTTEVTRKEWTPEKAGK